MGRLSIAPSDPDLALRQVALRHVRELATAFDDVVPLNVLREGFQFEGRRISFGSFMKGIHRAKEQEGPAALTLVTALEGPYDDFDDGRGLAQSSSFNLPLLRLPAESRISPRGTLIRVPGRPLIIARFPDRVTAVLPPTSSLAIRARRGRQVRSLFSIAFG
jgi:hypothetical protein